MTKRARKIAFIINSIGSGGAERVLQVLLENPPQEPSPELHLIVLDDLPQFRNMPGYVRMHVLNGREKLVPSTLALYGKLREIRPDIAVSFLVRANIANAALSRLLGYCAVLCERMHLTSHLEGYYSGLKLRIARFLPWASYRLARKVIGVSLGVSRDLVENFGVPAASVETIYNPYDMEALVSMSRTEPGIVLPEKFMVAVGRLAKSKNYPCLIEAYRKSGATMPLLILGEGTEEQSIKRIVASHGLEDRVKLLGYVANPMSIVARSHLYVSASLNEGFPNSMVEAMCLGIPVVSTDCYSGPAEILAAVDKMNNVECVEAENGILVPPANAEELAKGILRMLDPTIHAHYCLRSKIRAADFESKRVTSEYWAAFQPGDAFD